MTKQKALLLGCGNMAHALVASRWSEAFDLSVYTPTVVSAKKFVEMRGGKLVSQLESIKGEHFDLFLLFFKPQQFISVSEQLNELNITSDAALSVLASISAATLKERLVVDSVLRLMPNTPSKIGQGVITAYQDGDHAVFTDCIIELKKVAQFILFDQESLIDITTPVSGSGPAFIFELARIWQSFLVSQGVANQLAKQMVAHTFKGSSELLTLTTDDFSQLRDEVTSKKGVTEAGLISLSSRDFEQIVIESLDRCLQRIEELK